MGTAVEPMVRLRNIAKCYRAKAGFTYVLRQINLDIAGGEFVTIMGPVSGGMKVV
jgi:ABC-type lipoprotein export system ATPase subunit